MENARGLNLSGRDGGLLVICGELGCLSCDALEDVWNRVSKLQVRFWRGWECIPLTKEFKIDIARLEIPVSGWTCLRTTIEQLAKSLEWKTRPDVDE